MIARYPSNHIYFVTEYATCMCSIVFGIVPRLGRDCCSFQKILFIINIDIFSLIYELLFCGPEGGLVVIRIFEWQPKIY